MGIEGLNLFIKITYNQKDITSALAPYVTQINYSPSVGKKGSLSITLEDIAAKWRGPWYPVKTDKIAAEFGYDSKDTLKTGDTFIGEIRIAMPPDTVQIMASSADLTKAAETKKSETFKKKTLKEIAQKKAKDLGLTISGEIEDVKLEYKKQNNQSDFGFLKKLAEEYGYYMSVEGSKLIFAKKEKVQDKSTPIELDLKDCISLNFTDKTANVYKACTVSYWDNKKKNLISATVNAKGLKTGDTLIIKRRVENAAQAKKLAQSALTDKNERQVVAEVTVPGATKYTPGRQVKLSGVGVLSGTYTITTPKHSISRSAGWKCVLQMQRNELKPDDTQAAAKQKRGKKVKKSFDIPTSLPNADELVDDRGIKHRCQARTKAMFDALRELVHKEWPGREFWASCTVEGQHSSQAHYDGRAIDLGVYPMTAEESFRLESLARSVGFKTFNEYVNDSTYKTGAHMHVYWE